MYVRATIMSALRYWVVATVIGSESLELVENKEQYKAETEEFQIFA